MSRELWFPQVSLAISRVESAMLKWARSIGEQGEVQVVGAWDFPGIDLAETGIQRSDDSLRPVGDNWHEIVQSVLEPAHYANHEIGLTLLLGSDTSGDVNDNRKDLLLVIRLFPTETLLPDVEDMLAAIQCQPTDWWGWPHTPSGHRIASQVMTAAGAEQLRDAIACSSNLEMFTCESSMAALFNRPSAVTRAVENALGERGVRSEDPF